MPGQLGLVLGGPQPEPNPIFGTAQCGPSTYYQPKTYPPPSTHYICPRPPPFSPLPPITAHSTIVRLSPAGNHATICIGRGASGPFVVATVGHYAHGRDGRGRGHRKLPWSCRRCTASCCRGGASRRCADRSIHGSVPAVERRGSQPHRTLPPWATVRAINRRWDSFSMDFMRWIDLICL